MSAARLLRPRLLPRLPISVRPLQTRPLTPRPFAFAFDIDGVLLHGATPIPGAPEALSLLTHHRIPFLLLTNGGGRSETARVEELSHLLSTPLSTSQFVQSHTPFRTQTGAHNRVLVVGGQNDHCRAVAQDYGFRDVVIPADVLASARHRGVSPFSDVERYRACAATLGERAVVDAVFVFNDPRDWAADIQVIVDVLLSRGGEIGTRRTVAEVLEHGHVPVFFSNPDLWWANEYPHARLGQGGFRAALEGVWRAITGGKELKAETIGKPHRRTYEYAEDVLSKWVGGSKLEAVYMVGDNPASDIAGARQFNGTGPRGTPWVPVLVRTGVFRDGDDDGGAVKIAENVGEAVRWAMGKQGVKT